MLRVDYLISKMIESVEAATLNLEKEGIVNIEDLFE